VTLWQRGGVFVWNPAESDPYWFASVLGRYGFSWVALLVRENEFWDDAWLRHFRKAKTGMGIKIGGWAPLRHRPEDEAREISETLRKHNLGLFIANPEWEYKRQHGDVSEERFSRSGRFTIEFRRLRPKLPFGLSTYGRADLTDINWEPWIDRGARFLPQAYVNDFVDHEPATCLRFAARPYGSTKPWPLARVHPTIGAYPGQRGWVEPGVWVKMLLEAGVAAGKRGFSIYLASAQLDESYYAAFSVLNRR
jgi:hypothetical protein